MRAVVKKGLTAPPKHYTEAMLLAAMESAGADSFPDEAGRKGIGTPATRAGILESLVKSGYLQRKGKQIRSTTAGRMLVGVAVDELKDVKLTAQWEQSLADIEHRLEQLDEQFQNLLAKAIDAEDKEACNAQFAEILAEQTTLKKQKEEILQSSTDASRVCTRMKQAEQAIENATSTITEWNENAVRQIVERVTVLSADEILVRIKGGAEIKQRLER